MNVPTKKILKSGLISGFVYASLMAGFRHFDDKDFNIWKFLLHGSLFGIFMALLTRYNVKKQLKKENSNDQIPS